jgi:hypothetical protein
MFLHIVWKRIRESNNAVFGMDQIKCKKWLEYTYVQGCIETNCVYVSMYVCLDHYIYYILPIKDVPQHPHNF